MMKTLVEDYNIEEIDEFMDRMIQENDNDYILKYIRTDSSLIYNVDGLIPLREKYKMGIDFNDIKQIMTNLYESIKYLEKLMINEENLNILLNNFYQDKYGNILFKISPKKTPKNDVKILYHELLYTCIYKFDGREKDLLRINNYLNTENYSVEGLVKNFFKVQLESGLEPDVVDEDIIDEKKLEKDNERLYNEKAVLRDEASFIDKIRNRFFNKDYEVKSLNLDFKLPKK